MIHGDLSAKEKKTDGVTTVSWLILVTLKTNANYLKMVWEKPDKQFGGNLTLQLENIS